MRIEADGMGYSYHHGSPREQVALAGVSFEVDSGECLGIVGGPGAGKSTLARNLSGVLSPTAGRLLLEGVAADGSRSARRDFMARVGYLPQWPERQLFARTVSEDVSAGLGRGRKKPPGWENRVKAALFETGLDAEEMWSRPVLALSGGEARKVAVAGVIVLERPVVILDEPTAGLDARSRDGITRLMTGIKERGQTLLAISHRLSDLLSVADRILLMEKGRCLFIGGMEEILSPGEGLVPEAVRLPPLLDLMFRLKKSHGEIEISSADPLEACREIQRVLGGRNRN